ncbi:hypothetical protein DFH08DRAFT_316450 [Mycena albidolilacea]|uniref:NADH dehydrogenase [ubiquinone] iron-sulfur protein 5 n=1 Tax=Mycena albidolilacea TaxID=1033008 RepID=A0AAD7EIX7_9AGAR|nr:hypothetical protein DFH08DRAFT_316450 [Mycena albidolilacea]
MPHSCLPPARHSVARLTTARQCYTNATYPKQCIPQRDDYLECIHRTKEKARNAAIQAEFERQQARGLQDHKHKLDAQADGVPTRVGLVPTPPADTE